MNRHHLFAAIVAWRLCESAAAQPRPLEAIEADREAAEAEVRDLERRATALDEQGTQRKDQLQKRVRALYKLSGGGYLRVLAGTADLQALESREAGLRRLLQRDLDELEAIRDESRQLDREHARRADRIQHAFALAQNATRAAHDEQHLDVELQRPVDGKIVGSFGRYKDPETNHEFSRRGVELDARAGQRVRTPAAGAVTWVGDVPGLGQVVALDIGNGFTALVGRLRKVSVQAGARVAPKQALGEAAQPSVYLELAHQTTAIDPAGLLPPLIH